MSNFPRNKRKFFQKKTDNSKRRIPSDISTINTAPGHNYYAFKIYFPDEDLIDVTILLLHLKTCTKFINNNIQHYDFDTIRKTKWFVLDYKLLNSEEIPEWPELCNEITENAEYILDCFSLAMHQRIHEELIPDSVKIPFVLDKIRAKLTNYEPILQLKDLKVNVYEKLATVHGTVIRTGGVKIQCEYLAFSCSLCKGEQLIKQIDALFTPPTKCLTKYCQAKSNFIPLHSSKYTQTVNCQSLKIQELVGSDCNDYGRTPRTLECELIEDLVNMCMPGDDITITGVIKVKKEQSVKNQPSLFTMYMNAITIINNKNRNLGSYGAAERITFHTDDYYTIQKVHSQKNLLRYLVHSLCPNIFGHELVKTGLLLALFGGSAANSTRADSHILIIGDPGLGKSQMLQACTNVAPRGVYVSGNTSTSSGLTVTLCRESGGDYALEAGALMLADQGCCCIDEFDKMPTQHSALLEAMEQQSISIAKAGITCTIPSRATILAAANPAGGHYNKAKTVAENLKISAPMLSRFDLIFVILDNPDEEVDMMMSRHVLGMHSYLNNTTLSNTTMTSDNTKNSLRSKLQIDENESIEPLPHTLFRKYIAYAQKYVNPIISDEAQEIIKTFYLNLRKKFQTGDSTPVTTRQLQSLIRLTQARARLELREEASEEDAKEVIEIMEKSLGDIFTDEAGILDTTRSLNSTGMSRRNKGLRLISSLQQLSKTSAKSIFSLKEIKILGDKIGIPSEKLQGIIETLNIQGYLLYKGSNNYQLLSA